MVTKEYLIEILKENKVFEEGDFTLSVGGQNVNVRCTETILWDQPNID